MWACHVGATSCPLKNAVMAFFNLANRRASSPRLAKQQLVPQLCHRIPATAQSVEKGETHAREISDSWGFRRRTASQPLFNGVLWRNGISPSDVVPENG